MPALARFAAALTLALTGCAGVNVCRIAPPTVPAAAPPLDPLPLRIAVAVEPVEALTVSVTFDRTWVFPLEAPLRGAFEGVARELSRPVPAGTAPGRDLDPDAVLSVRMLGFHASLPNLPRRRAAIELETTLRTRAGAVLASVRGQGASPSDVPFAFISCPVMEEAAAAAIEDVAKRTRDALAAAPGVTALRGAPHAPAGASALAAAGPSPVLAAKPGDLRPRIEEFSDLRWPAARDLVVAARVDRLTTRRKASGVLTSVGSVSALLAIWAGVGIKQTYYAPAPPDAPRRKRYPEAAAALGVTALTSFVAAIAVWPGVDTWREVVDLWNRRNPDEPLEFRAESLAPAEPTR